MRWLLMRCCVLALIHLTAAMTPALTVSQIPRFYGMRIHQNVLILCQPSKQHLPTQAMWYKANVYDSQKTEIVPGARIQTYSRNLTKNGKLYLKDLHIEDSGVYFCKLNNTWGPGTALQVARSSSLAQIQFRSQVKDGLMILQGLLLAGFIALVVQYKQNQLKEKDCIYEEPETDHIYEGLAIEACGGGLYEELSVYAQVEGGEAPWE